MEDFIPKGWIAHSATMGREVPQGSLTDLFFKSNGVEISITRSDLVLFNPPKTCNILKY